MPSSAITRQADGEVDRNPDNFRQLLEPTIIALGATLSLKEAWRRESSC